MNPGKAINIRLFIALILLLSLPVSCRQLIRLSEQNMAHTYNADLRLLSPSYTFQHLSRDSSLLTISILSNDLLYVRQGRDGQLIARFGIRLMQYDSFESRRMVDSVQTVFTDTLRNGEPYQLQRSIRFSAPAGVSSILYSELHDINRRVSDSRIYLSDKRHARAPGFFSIRQNNQANRTQYPFRVHPGENYTLYYTDTLSFQMVANFYPHISQIPAPPYVDVDDQHLFLPTRPAARSFRISFRSGEATFSPDQPGIYHFHEPGNPSHGFVVLCNEAGFPAITHGMQMLKPLRYISSRQEYDLLFSIPDARVAGERFWLQSAGNPDRAREIMNMYYKRVEEANQLFSSFIPGWQTDQGMIYIIFGPPQRVYSNNNTESWYYPEGVNIPEARFVFSRHETIYTAAHFVLERNTTHRNAWNRAVNIWRR